MIKDVLQTKIMENEYINFVNHLKEQIFQYDINNDFSEIVFLCVGTNKVVGDMIGPMVGERIKNIEINNGKKDLIIFGTMQETLNLKNATRIIDKIKCSYKNPFIITIDTALGRKECEKKIYISRGNIEIGKAVSNGIKYYSHINIKGVVGNYCDTIEENIETLKKVKLSKIIYLANIISKGITEVINYI